MTGKLRMTAKMRITICCNSLDENALKEKLNSTICCDFTLASPAESAMLM
jgi:hypothetical protein